ncbi:MAG: hypothetical protein KatS3mg031_0321 [Chitinophagales bacterium]|nr:MAG: hypothetical protein KatS3mg031_0321 [Chitinophagales bacterium]
MHSILHTVRHHCIPLSRLITSVLLLFISLAASPQPSYRCGTDEVMRRLYADYPQLEDDYKLLFENNKKFVQDRNGNRTMVYTIPIVFHVLHEYGPENISDEQIFDQVRILNEDFRKLNPDTAQIVAAFKSVAADSRIEFRLASKDPKGNCTNGIERIYTHETHNGDNYSKLNQWPRRHYLNVWVVKSMEPGVAGYAYYPSATAEEFFYADGIVILHNHVGSIGTSSYSNSRTLTHEIGHYLGLPHVWGSNNEPGVSCGDDGFADTPITKGWTMCRLTNTAICTPGVQENVQNYMEYSYCTRMFTHDQAAFMQATLNSDVAGRNNLWTAENHAITGIDGPAPMCTPQPDFYASRRLVCTGGTVTFKSVISRAAADTYQWSFPGGTPSTSTDPNPVVQFNIPGWQFVSLTVTNAAGSATITMDKFIYVSATQAETGPYFEDFETAMASQWIIENPGNNATQWTLAEGAGRFGTRGFFLNNSPLDISDQLFFHRLGGQKDVLISPSYDLSTLSDPVLYFEYSCATRGLTTDELTEKLAIYVSTNCGNSWNLIRTVSGAELATAGYSGIAFRNTSADMWRGINIPLGPAYRQSNVRFKFEYSASDKSNNIYLDNVNVGNGLVLSNFSPDNLSFTLYPNPVDGNQPLTIACPGCGPGTHAWLHDLAGKLILNFSMSAHAGSAFPLFNLSPTYLQPGVYFITLADPNHALTRKIIIH